MIEAGLGAAGSDVRYWRDRAEKAEQENSEWDDLLALVRRRETPYIHLWRRENPEKRRNVYPDFGGLMQWLKEQWDAEKRARRAEQKASEERIAQLKARLLEYRNEVEKAWGGDE